MSAVTQDELEKDWREAFGLFDRNGDGVIAFEELAGIMRILGNNPTDQELQAMMADLDVDKSGTVELDEFLCLMRKHWKDPYDEEQELQAAFRVFDRDNDGYVVAGEIQYVMKGLGHDLSMDVVTQIIREADTDGDGKLNYHEFVRVMQKPWSTMAE